MSNYPQWWNSTLTLYNKYEDPVTNAITWHRTVLTNCFWKQHFNTQTTLGETIEVSSPIIICRIPKNEKFIDVYGWKNLNVDTIHRKFTLQNGDIIINGLVKDEINEYVKGSRASDLVNRYKDKGLLTISLYVDNSDDSRFIPHYFVR